MFSNCVFRNGRLLFLIGLPFTLQLLVECSTVVDTVGLVDVCSTVVDTVDAVDVCSTVVDTVDAFNVVTLGLLVATTPHSIGGEYSFTATSPRESTASFGSTPGMAWSMSRVTYLAITGGSQTKVKTAPE